MAVHYRERPRWMAALRSPRQSFAIAREKISSIRAKKSRHCERKNHATTSEKIPPLRAKKSRHCERKNSVTASAARQSIGWCVNSRGSEGRIRLSLCWADRANKDSACRCCQSLNHSCAGCAQELAGDTLSVLSHRTIFVSAHGAVALPATGWQ